MKAKQGNKKERKRERLAPEKGKDEKMKENR